MVPELEVYPGIVSNGAAWVAAALPLLKLVLGFILFVVVLAIGEYALGLRNRSAGESVSGGSGRAVRKVGRAEARRVMRGSPSGGRRGSGGEPVRVYNSYYAVAPWRRHQNQRGR